MTEYPTCRVVSGHGGICVLYRDGIPHYVGKAGKLLRRIKAHTNDGLKRKWDTLSLYVIRGGRQIKDMETLLPRIVEPMDARFRECSNEGSVLYNWGGHNG